MKGMKIGKEEIALSLFRDEMAFYIGNSKESNLVNDIFLFSINQRGSIGSGFINS
jgi:hypothetical protein